MDCYQLERGRLSKKSVGAHDMRPRQLTVIDEVGARRAPLPALVGQASVPADRQTVEKPR